MFSLDTRTARAIELSKEISLVPIPPSLASKYMSIPYLLKTGHHRQVVIRNNEDTDMTLTAKTAVRSVLRDVRCHYLIGC